MPRKSKLDNLNQVHGKVENPVTLDQIWGDTGENKYGTLNLEDYEKYVSDLNKSDLQAHAVKVGLVPIDDRKTLVARLKREFVKHVSQYNVKPLDKKEPKLSKKVKDILSEGR
jgi:hypothetical protein